MLFAFLSPGVSAHHIAQKLNSTCWQCLHIEESAQCRPRAMGSGTPACAAIGMLSPSPAGESSRCATAVKGFRSCGGITWRQFPLRQRLVELVLNRCRSVAIGWRYGVFGIAQSYRRLRRSGSYFKSRKVPLHAALTNAPWSDMRGKVCRL